MSPQSIKMLKATSQLIIVVLGLLCAFAALNWSQYTSTKDSMSEAEVCGLICDQPVVDMGRLKSEKANISHTFILKNTSSKPIKVIDTHSSCSCTIATITSHDILPGESTKVLVRSNLLDQVGDINQNVLLITNHASTKHIKLTLKAYVIVHASISPPGLHFGVLDTGEKKTEIVEIINDSDSQPFRVLSVSNPSLDIVLCRLNTAGIPDSNYPVTGNPGKFAVTLTAPKKPGIYRDVIKFHTNLKSSSDISLVVTVQVKASVQSPFVFSPPHSNLIVKKEVPMRKFNMIR